MRKTKSHVDEHERVILYVIQYIHIFLKDNFPIPRIPEEAEVD